MIGLAHPMRLANTYPEPRADAACAGWWVAEDYDSGTGNWLDRVAGILGNQSTAGKRPTTTTIQGTTWVRFDGTDDDIYIDGITAGGLFVTLPASVVMLIVTRTPSANSHLWSAGDSTDADNTRQLRWNNTAGGTLRTVWSDRAAAVTAYDHSLADQQNFHTVALVDNLTTRSVYCDGVKFASDPRANSIALDALTKLTLGANRRFGTEADYGNFDLKEISFHSRVFDSTDVRVFGAGMRARAHLDPLG